VGPEYVFESPQRENPGSELFSARPVTIAAKSLGGAHMAKKKKPKPKVSAAKHPGLAKTSATRTKDFPVSVGRREEAAATSDAKPRPSLANEEEKVAISSDVPRVSPATSTVRQVDVTLGQIVTILMRSPQHRERPLADLEWLVLPAILSGQFRVAQAQQSGTAVPVGVALWASVSTPVDQRLSDLSVPWRLQPDEWRSGDIPWLVELVADPVTQQALLKHLGETVFKGRGIKMRVRDADGKAQIGMFRGAA
jgi:hemolysin-activating ACP:hemolysin acyltransferase